MFEGKRGPGPTPHVSVGVAIMQGVLGRLREVETAAPSRPILKATTAVAHGRCSRNRLLGDHGANASHGGRHIDQKPSRRLYPRG